MDEPRILIVEDDPRVSEDLEAICERALTSHVLLSMSVAEARIALRQKIDFALLDVDVLDGTTYEFAADLATKRIPFAFISASDREQMPVQLRSVPFIAKPYEEREIVDLLQSARANGRLN